MFKNTASQKLTVLAFADAGHATLDAGEPVTGDAANITCKVEQDDDGTRDAVTDTNPTETEDGQYVFDLTQAETNGDKLTFYPQSSTAGVQVVAMPSSAIYTRPAGFTSLTAATIATAVWASGTRTLTSISGLGIALASKLLAYVQLLARSDAAIATDNATELSEINADGGSGAGDYASTTDSQEAIMDSGGGGLTQQQVADALKLAPTAGTPATGSVNADLDTLISRTAGGVTVTFVNPVSQSGTTLSLVRGQAYLDALSNAVELDITHPAFSTSMTSDGTTVTLKLQKRRATASPILITGTVESVDGTTATVKFELYRSSDDDSGATFGSIELEPGDNRYRFDVEFAMAGASGSRLTPIADGEVNVTADIPDAA